MVRSLKCLLLCASLAVVTSCYDSPNSHYDARDASLMGEKVECQGPADCGADELCVVDPDDPYASSCMQRCSITRGDVCPVGEHCAPVVRVADDGRAAACVPGTVISQKSWQQCQSPLECGEGESCVYLDAVLKARCVPACNPDDSCRRASESCLLHWDGDQRASSGCARRCTDDADCESGWHCAQGESVSGLCVR